MKTFPFACRWVVCLALIGVGAGARVTVASDAAQAPAASTASFEHTLQPFLATYCTKCHGADKQKGERRFDQLPATIGNDSTLVDYQDILDQLNLGEMPPKEAKQPGDDERRTVVEWLTGQIGKFHEELHPTGQGTVLRRLNSREYRNTVRDLLHLDMTIFDPTVDFPRDQLEEHLDNVGESLVTSGHLLNRYLDAADKVIEKALYPLERPPVRTWEFHDHFRQQPEIDQVHGRTNGFTWLTLYDVPGADMHEGAYAPLLEFKQGVPYDGWYEMTFKAEALNRINPYDAEFLGLNPEEPLRLGIVAGNIEAGPLHKPQPVEPLLAEMALQDGAQTVTVKVWLDKGFTPRFTFPNGLMNARGLWNKIIKKYPDQFPKLRRPGIVEARYTAIKYSRLPQIHVDDVIIRGPLIEEWPTASQKELLGENCEAVLAGQEMTSEQQRRQLTAFASRAYRRPAQPDEIERLLKLIEVRREAGESPLEAWQDALKGVLCSPSFLYLDEEGNDGGKLAPYALASRLSYFLWSSMPDEALLKLAASGELVKPEVLDAQVERMLADGKSSAFIDGFLNSWLTLRDLGSTPPEREKFQEFYHYDLGRAMRQETTLFTRALLDENESVVNFLDSDFTFVNVPLAKLYGLTPPKGAEFERVSLTDHRRGGLLGQASVLTVTANGVDTSPVVRGVWLLNNILGTPPNPPPPDVEPLDPDVRGTVTIRDQLEKHRGNPSCYDCHRKIDPLGFALENFDPIGKWRTTYEKNNRVDSAGELPGGKEFQDVVGLKRILVEQQEPFVRALTTRLLAYATGRKIEATDRAAIDGIVKELAATGNGFRDLVKLVAQSEPFASP